MARFTKLEVLQTAAEQGMVSLFYHPDIELGKKVLKSCYKGGARILEFTNRGDYAHEVFAQLNIYCEKELPEMILGVGSIPDAGTAALYIQLGANFIVTPSLREDVVKTCNRRKIPCMPGCGSLTEIGQAEELGCDVVKLFPGSNYGADFVKSIKAPQPWTSIMPTGGVTPERQNLQQWFGAGVICVGMGSQMISKDILANGNFEKLENRVRDTLFLIEVLRNK